MNETTTTLSDLPEYEQEFAEAIIKIIEGKHRKYETEYQKGKESKRVPLADLHFEIKDENVPF